MKRASKPVVRSIFTSSIDASDDPISCSLKSLDSAPSCSLPNGMETPEPREVVRKGRFEVSDVVSHPSSTTSSLASLDTSSPQFIQAPATAPNLKQHSSSPSNKRQTNPHRLQDPTRLVQRRSLSVSNVLAGSALARLEQEQRRKKALLQQHHSKSNSRGARMKRRPSSQQDWFKKTKQSVPSLPRAATMISPSSKRSEPAQSSQPVPPQRHHPSRKTMMASLGFDRNSKDITGVFGRFHVSDATTSDCDSITGSSCASSGIKAKSLGWTLSRKEVRNDSLESEPVNRPENSRKSMLKRASDIAWTAAQQPPSISSVDETEQIQQMRDLMLKYPMQSFQVMYEIFQDYQMLQEKCKTLQTNLDSMSRRLSVSQVTSRRGSRAIDSSNDTEEISRTQTV